MRVYRAKQKLLEWYTKQNDMPEEWRERFQIAGLSAKTDLHIKVIRDMYQDYINDKRIKKEGK
jgi:hypothetical protein